MKTFALLVSSIMCLFVLVLASIPDKQTHWGIKNCELAEISPDFTPQEKANCRIARSKAK
jgi:hypothetical protein